MKKRDIHIIIAMFATVASQFTLVAMILIGFFG